MAKKCELCSAEAKTHCESDGASLCWDCDGRVHSANFLVAKHRRTLLCRLCHSATPWSASGPSLSPTVSLCPSCLSSYQRHHRPDSDKEDDDDESLVEDDVDNDAGDEDDDDDDDDDNNEDEDDEDEENQVVPWSKPPRSVSSSSSSSSSTTTTTSTTSSSHRIFRR